LRLRRTRHPRRRYRSRGQPDARTPPAARRPGRMEGGARAPGVRAPLLSGLVVAAATAGRATFCRVNTLSACGSARPYSVPTSLVGKRVDLLPVDGRLRVIRSLTGDFVADHPLTASGGTSNLDEHYGSARPKTAAEKQFLARGRVAHAFLSGAAAAGFNRLPTSSPRSSRSTTHTGVSRCWPRWNGASPSVPGELATSAPSSPRHRCRGPAISRPGPRTHLAERPDPIAGRLHHQVQHRRGGGGASGEHAAAR
jgi:hypothetical protein